ncbi:MAG: pseudouridine synthase [Gammaproteobacteria bacterium]|nr:MAG: pseudouridine synthase [Gammaproteobacteria bacterium]
MHRIQKIMSMLGLVSRRDAEKLIDAKKIRINGKFATIGQKIFINDIIVYENKKYVITNKLINTKIQLLAYHKRYGEIVTKKTIQTNNTVFENLPKSDSRWINIGRLDVNSTGLLLFTNSGDLAHKLMHPSSRIIRTYNVSINRVMNKSEINKSLSGLDIGNGEVGKFHKIKYKERDNIYEVSLMTGKNREIRRIFNTLGFRVTMLHRIKYGDVSLDALKPGKIRYIKSDTSKLFFY